MKQKDSALKKEKSDEELAEAFLKDFTKIELFEELILRYEPKLLRYVRSLGIEQNLADDVVQEAFIKAYRNIRSYNPKKGKWSSWMYRIGHNAAMDSFKKQKKDLTVDDDVWWDGIAVPETITEELELKFNNQDLMQNLAKLEIKLREPLMLNYIEAKSYKEIASILRMPVATVSTRIRRGKIKLKEVMVAREDSKGLKVPEALEPEKKSSEKFKSKFKSKSKSKSKKTVRSKNSKASKSPKKNTSREAYGIIIRKGAEK
jgi:RNA polymerase sigma-70 factor (ECF subfamily)